jgi:zeaxanthin glucosyltransferase
MEKQVVMHFRPARLFFLSPELNNYTMARIIFIMDTEEGHILPSFGLAHELKDKGHDILYVSISDNEKLVKEQGFDFLPVFKDVYPPGFRKEYKISGRNDQPEWKHLQLLMSSAYENFLKDLNADLFVVSVFLKFDLLLLYYKFKIRPVIFNAILREPGRTIVQDCIDDILQVPVEINAQLFEWLKENNINVHSLQQLAAPLNVLTELFACPQEFDFVQNNTTGNAVYIGPSLHRKQNGNSNNTVIDRITQAHPEKKLLFASLGSQAVSYGDVCRTFFKKMLMVMEHKCMKNSQLILCVGPDIAVNDIGTDTDNVNIVTWISQLDVLKKAHLAITHGGLGTLKECIYYGVPVIVSPVARDQPANAQRILKRGLGEVVDIYNFSVEELREKIHSVMNSETIRKNIDTMKRIFRETEAAAPGAKLIEKMLAEQLTRDHPPHYIA